MPLLCAVSLVVGFFSTERGFPHSGCAELEGLTVDCLGRSGQGIDAHVSGLLISGQLIFKVSNLEKAFIV